MDQTRLSVSVILKPVVPAELALFHLFQDQTDQSVTDQDQLVDVLNITLLMVTAACNAQLDRSLMN